MLIPLGIAFWCGEESAVPFILTIGAAVAVSFLCQRRGHVRTKALTIREGIAITGLGWLLATGLGMLPYVLGGYLGILDGLFESISGFTGTGATVIADLEVLPDSILFWRSMTHWLGGLGIVVIFIALLPEAGQSTMSMYNAEVAGPTRERVLPRLHDMTNVLFRMYSGFTLIALVIFLLCGMDFINALNHALSTISAGGFSTFNASVAHFDDSVVEGWITFFMILAGGNFGLYYQVYQKGPGVLRRNTEFKAYLLILGVVTLLIMLNLAYAFGGEWTTAFRYASFQVASIATTGFVSADYDTWPAFSKLLLLFLMICGAVPVRRRRASRYPASSSWSRPCGLRPFKRFIQHGAPRRNQRPLRRRRYSRPREPVFLFVHGLYRIMGAAAYVGRREHFRCRRHQRQHHGLHRPGLWDYRRDVYVCEFV